MHTCFVYWEPVTGNSMIFNPCSIFISHEFNTVKILQDMENPDSNNKVIFYENVILVDKKCS